MVRECTGCGCLFKPLVNDIKCPHCGGGRGEISKTPLKRIKELQNRVEILELDLETLSSNALKRTEQLQDAIKGLEEEVDFLHEEKAGASV